MELKVTLCSRRIGGKSESLYLYIRLNGKVSYEFLNIFIDNSKEGEELNNKLIEAENIRLQRFYELLQNPNLLYERQKEENKPPKYLYVGRISRNGGSYRYIPEGLKKHIETLKNKLFAFADFTDLVNDFENIIKNTCTDKQEISTFLKIKPESYNNPRAYISLSLIRNQKSIAVEIFGYPCDQICEPHERKIVIDQTKKIIRKTKKKKEQSKTYLMTDKNLGYTKIGKSVNVLQREHTLEAQNPNISLFAVCQQDIERELHMKFKEFRIRGEWFKLNKKQIENIIRDYNFTTV